MKTNYTALVIKDSKGFVVEAIINPTKKQIRDIADMYPFYRCYSKDTTIIFDAR